jgi:hypothetical protein
MDWPALPVAILVGLHFVEAVIDADGLVHASVCSTASPDLQHICAIRTVDLRAGTKFAVCIQEESFVTALFAA